MVLLKSYVFPSIPQGEPFDKLRVNVIEMPVDAEVSKHEARPE